MSLHLTLVNELLPCTFYLTCFLDDYNNNNYNSISYISLKVLKMGNLIFAWKHFVVCTVNRCRIICHQGLEWICHVHVIYLVRECAKWKEMCEVLYSSTNQTENPSNDLYTTLLLKFYWTHREIQLSHFLRKWIRHVHYICTKAHANTISSSHFIH